jgi:hypothetical protein
VSVCESRAVVLELRVARPGFAARIPDAKHASRPAALRRTSACSRRTSGTTPSTQTDSHLGRASVQAAAGRSPFWSRRTLTNAIQSKETKSAARCPAPFPTAEKTKLARKIAGTVIRLGSHESRHAGMRRNAKPGVQGGENREHAPMIVGTVSEPDLAEDVRRVLLHRPTSTAPATPSTGCRSGPRQPESGGTR